MSSNGDGFEQASDTVAALHVLTTLDLTTLDLTTLPDADIARLLQTAETARRKLDGLGNRLIGEMQDRGIHNTLTTPRPEGRGFSDSHPGVPVSPAIADGRTRAV
ncbi:hypothetical protein ACFWB0_21195 [Rhodococcus sp. NPDC060086]|uniref:hypothetical protein n=1 Tax=Rhodococcus sp. NPDC060086 TaxID=3347055 RepID=UPI00365C71FA